MNKSSLILPLMLIIAGLLEIRYPGVLLIKVIPETIAVYQQQAVSFNPILIFAPAVLTTAFILFEIFSGIRLLIIYLQTRQFSNRDKKIAIILFISGILITIFGSAFSVGLIVNPLYETLSNY